MYVVSSHSLFTLVIVCLALLAPSEGNFHGIGQDEPSTMSKSRGLTRQKRQTTSYCPDRPALISLKDTRSYLVLYSPQDRSDVKISSPTSSSTIKRLESKGFNSSKPTHLYLHAYTQNARIGWLMDIRQRFNEMYPKGDREEPPYNLLFFDWSAYSQQQYPTSVSWVPHLGAVVGRFLNQLVEQRSYNMTDMHLISYSLSTHIAGQAGRRMSSDHQVGQITALDPTGVCFHENNEFARKYLLRPTDAQLVVAKHYDMNGFGSKRLIGGVDILVNGGQNQPGTSGRRGKRQVNDYTDDKDKNEEEDDSEMLVFRVSSHFRASEHATDKVNENCHEMAYACRNYQAFLAGECGDCGSKGNKCFLMSILDLEHNNATSLSYKRNTKMFIQTAAKAPFCLHHYQVVVRLNQNVSSDARQLITSGGLQLEFGSKLKAIPQHDTGDNNYTALVLSKRRVKASGVKLTSNSKSSKLRDLIEYIDLNYLSSPEQKEREKASVRYCRSNSTSDSFVIC